jgi:imidazolonepropionase-like amidohydrolase
MIKQLMCILLVAAQASNLSPSVREFVSVDAPVVALTHLRVIDGTGAAPRENQTIIISGGKIQSIANADDAAIPAGARTMNLNGYTAIPGLVGMHEHLFYPAGNGMYHTQAFSFPRLYLAGGVTTIRTGGSMEPFTDLNVKAAIDEGRQLGPKMHVTGPYLNGVRSTFLQMHKLTGPEEARQFVNYWADRGVTSFKAYTNITRDELRVAIEEAHKRGIKVTGHLCSVGFREAAELGIDNLEHGLLVDTEFNPGKQPDICPQQPTQDALLKLDVKGPEIQQTIQTLVRRRVAITSTLVVFELSVPNRPVLPSRVLDAMSPEARSSYLLRRARSADTANSPWPQLFKKEMEFERDFVRAGGVLVAGVDPTGSGGALPGFGDQRNVQLLVEAGFTLPEAIKIATANGAELLGESSRIGTLAAGKQADIVVIKGNPVANIADFENVEIVFKDGIGYDSAKLFASVKGTVGLY